MIFVRFSLGCLCALAVFPLKNIAASPQPEPYREQKMDGHLLVPRDLGFQEDLLQTLQLPPQFSIQIFARDLENPRMLACGPNGIVYFTSPKSGQVFALRDTDADGRADEQFLVAEGIENVHGIAIHAGQLFLASDTKLFSGSIDADGRVESFHQLRDDLPEGAQHPHRTIAFGPDDQLYISVGSSCNACLETNPEHATILRSNPDGSHREIFARGLRNTSGFDWHPVTGELWGMDPGTDWRGDDQPPEELNRIEYDNHYGWPFVWGDRQIDPLVAAAPDNITREEFAKSTTPPALTHTAHSSPTALAFYIGDQFPEPYRNDAFVAFHGSWNRKPPSGYKIARIRFDEAGQPIEFEDFITGFLQTVDGKPAQFGRPTGLTFSPDGTLFFSDDTHGIIYRVTYSSKAD